MSRVSFLRIVCAVLFSVVFSSSTFAQLCGGIYPPCPTPAPAPAPPTAPAPAPPAPTPAPTVTTPPAPAPAPAPTAAPAPGATPAPTAVIPPAPPPTPAPPPVPTPVVTTSTVTPTGVTVISTTPTTAAVAGIPGYAPSKDYGIGRTVAYIIAPFAIVGASYLIGQREVEIHPYGGFFWPGSTDKTNFRDEGIFGVKASTSLSDYFAVEGNFGYINHFESRFAPTTLDQSFGIPVLTVHAFLYDVNGVVDFGKRPSFGGSLSPYVTAGVGGLSTKVRNGTAAVVGGQFYTAVPSTDVVVLDPSQGVVVADNSPFFSFNYGAGLKATNVWGLMGFRFDVRGRTFPNFRGDVITWPEATAGLTFTFGEQ